MIIKKIMTTTANSSKQNNLWDLALTERKDMLQNAEKGNLDLSNVANESHLLVCGSKDSGKTSIVQRFLERDEPPKPTVGLDFCYGRKSKQNNVSSVKDVTQIWELGGGTSMIKLIDHIITPSNIRSLSIVLILDLSQPQQLWETQQLILSEIRKRIENVIAEASKTDSSLKTDLMSKAWERIGKNHVDKNMISPLLVPLVIIGSKYDIHQTLDNDKRHMISKTIRFLAHFNGGMAQYFSTKAEGLSGRTKGIVNHLAFNTVLSKTSSFEPSKPLIVPFGADSMEQIGAPPVSTDHLMRSRGGTPSDLWKDAFSSTFPPDKILKSEKSNPTTDTKFADEMIDNLRSQKDEELERYRKLSERKAKESRLNASVGKRKMKI